MAWTLETLKEHLEIQLDAQSAYFTSALQAHKEHDIGVHAAEQESIRKAEVSLDHRLSTMNEFRAAMTDQAATYLPRQEYTMAHTNLIDRMLALTARLDKTDGQSQGSNNTLGYVIGAFGLIIGVFGIVAHLWK